MNIAKFANEWDKVQSAHINYIGAQELHDDAQISQLRNFPQTAAAEKREGQSLLLLSDLETFAENCVQDNTPIYDNY